jgi:hemerythrin-like metal-binding protein
MSWTVELSVGIESIDAQHRELIELLNNIHEARLQGAERATIGKLLTDGLRLTAAHFEHEEKIMKENGFPLLAEHKKEHDSLIDEVKTVAHSFAAGRKVDSQNVEQFLKAWWIRHIKTSDRACGEFLISKGVK